MIKIFGSMPVSELAAAQALSKSKSNINLAILGIFIAGGICFYIGYKISENKKIQKQPSL